jgi:hypothetical protein
MTTYTRSLSSDFGGNLVRSRLHREIDANPTITTTLIGIAEPSGDDVNITFVSGLSWPELTALNGVVAAHSGASFEPEIRLDKAGTSNTWVLFSGTQTSNRTVIIPDADFTIVGDDINQVIINKNIHADNNFITSISDGNIATGASINAFKIGDGTVSSLEFGYLNGVTSSIQNQINGKAAVSHTHVASDVSSGTFADARISQSSVIQHETAINHNSLQNFDSNQHIDHSSVSIIAGEGMSGGGTITTTRTLNLDINGLTMETSPDGANDYLAIYDSSAGNHKKVLLENISTTFPTTTRGDLVVFNGSNNVRLPVGTNGYVLTANSDVSEGVEWANFGGNLALVQARKTVAHSITSSWTTITFDTTDVETKPTVVEHDNSNPDRINVLSGGLYEVYYNVSAEADFGTFHDIETRILINGVTQLPGSYSSGANYGTSSHIRSASQKRVIYNFNSNDYVILQIRYDAAVTGKTTYDPLFTVKKLESSLKGDPGSGSSLIFKDQNVTISGGPFNTVNYMGDLIEATDGGSGEIDVTVVLPSSTKGDLITHNGSTDIRLPVGNDGEVLQANSGENEGLQWVEVTARKLASATTTIDISSASAPSSGQVLTATSSSSATWQNGVTGAGSSLDLEVARFNGTNGISLEGAGVRDYGASATDPTSPTPQAGDKYYNTTINHEMRYDGSRSKWLSVATLSDGAGRNGSTVSGAFYRRFNGMNLAASRGPHVQKGTIVRIGYSTATAVNHTLEVLVNGVVISSLNSGGGASASDETLNDDFDAGILSIRNASGFSSTNDLQCVVYYKLRG